MIYTLLIAMLGFWTPASTSESDLKDDIVVVDYAGLEAYLAQYADRTVVLNFWATWCAPCVKELPYFEQVTATYQEKDVVVVLASLDFSKQIDKKLKPFLRQHQLKSKVVLLDDPDQNTWIEKVDERWSGAIPVTLLIDGDRRAFYEKTFSSFEELNTIIQSFLNS